jgi:hypothetical protein
MDGPFSAFFQIETYGNANSEVISQGNKNYQTTKVKYLGSQHALRTRPFQILSQCGGLKRI